MTLKAGMPRDGEWARDLALVFLVGSPRSGTTWLQAMLACHCEISTGPETGFFSAFSRADAAFARGADRRVGLSEYWSADQYRQIVEDLFSSLIAKLPPPPSPPRYFLEKSPQHCQHAEFILRIFPEARFIHLIRDARAVVASMLHASTGWGRDWAPRTVADATGVWMRSVEAGRRIKQQVGHPDQYWEVRYEDLRRDPEGHLARIFAWLGLPAEESLIRAAADANAIERVRGSARPFASIPLGPGEGAQREAYPGGFIGPAPCAPEDVELTRPQRLRVEDLAGRWLVALGYPLSESGRSVRERLLSSPRMRRLLRLPEL